MTAARDSDPGLDVLLPRLDALERRAREPQRRELDAAATGGADGVRNAVTRPVRRVERLDLEIELLDERHRERAQIAERCRTVDRRRRRRRRRGRASSMKCFSIGRQLRHDDDSARSSSRLIALRRRPERPRERPRGQDCAARDDGNHAAVVIDGRQRQPRPSPCRSPATETAPPAPPPATGLRRSRTRRATSGASAGSSGASCAASPSRSCQRTTLDRTGSRLALLRLAQRGR